MFAIRALPLFQKEFFDERQIVVTGPIAFFDAVPVGLNFGDRDGFPRLVFIEITDVIAVEHVNFSEGIAVDEKKGDAAIFLDGAEVADLLRGDIVEWKRSAASGTFGLKVDIVAFVDAVIVGRGLGLKIGLGDLCPK